MKDVFWIAEPFDNVRSESNHFKWENIRTTHYDILDI